MEGHNNTYNNCHSVMCEEELKDINGAFLVEWNNQISLIRIRQSICKGGNSLFPLLYCMALNPLSMDQVTQNWLRLLDEHWA